MCSTPSWQTPEGVRKMVMLGGLYVTQFLGLGFVITAVPAIMRANGADLDDIGWIYALGLVWSVKFLWAPLIDRYGSERHGHYRSWLVMLQSALVLSLIAASFFDVGSQLGVLAVFFVGISFLSATQDIAADALAVTVLRSEERGWGNTVQTAGGFIGNLIGGGLVLIAYDWLGWRASLWILAIGTSLPLVNVLLHEEQPAPADARDEKVSMRDLARYFRRPDARRWLPILLTYTLGISVAYALINPMLVDLGWGLDRIGFAVNVVGSLVSILGSVGAGWAVHRFGRKATMFWSNVLVGVSIVGLVPAALGTDSAALIYASICLMLIAYGANTTILATMMMDKSDPASAGTDYSLQYSLSTLLAFVLSGLALAMAEAVGYVGVLALGVVFVAVSLPFVWSYDGYDP